MANSFVSPLIFPDLNDIAESIIHPNYVQDFLLHLVYVCFEKANPLHVISCQLVDWKLGHLQETNSKAKKKILHPMTATYRSSPLSKPKHLSYLGFLKGELRYAIVFNAKSCFLLCCLFREDAEIPIDDLTRHCMVRSFAFSNLKHTS